MDFDGVEINIVTELTQHHELELTHSQIGPRFVEHPCWANLNLNLLLEQNIFGPMVWALLFG